MTTKIEWTHPPGYAGESWNPTTGCSHVSAGCDHCYAARFSHRGMCEAHKGLTVIGQSGPLAGAVVFNGTIKLHEDRLDLPLRRKAPMFWFVDSMSDLFHPNVHFPFIDSVMASIALCPQHRFIILTKRPKRMSKYFANPNRDREVERAVLNWHKRQAPRYTLSDRLDIHPLHVAQHLRVRGLSDEYWWPLNNLVLGVSVEDQATADERIPLLDDCPAECRCVSYEPALGPVNFGEITPVSDDTCIDALDGHLITPSDCYHHPKLDWVISGGESGPGARPTHPDWHRSIRDQCASAGVPFFFKQWGEWRPPVPEEEYSTAKGQAQRTPAYIVSHNGTVRCFNSEHIDRGEVMLKVGKTRAGRLLDGREHSEYPPLLMDRATEKTQ